MPRNGSSAFREGRLGALAILARIAVLGLLAAGEAHAAGRFVATSGTDAGDCSIAAAPCQTLVYAITQAAGGDTIEMAGGVYAEEVVLDTSATLIVSGGWSSDFATRDPVGNPTRVRGVPGGSSGAGLSDVFSVTASSGETIDLTLDGLNIGPGAHGIVAHADGDGVLSLIVRGSLIRGNRGGGLDSKANDTASVTVTVDASVVTRNSSSGSLLDAGAGIRAGTFSSTPMMLTLTGSTIERNRVSNIYPGGGVSAVAFSPGSQIVLAIDRCTFSRNSTLQSVGGALRAGVGSGQLDLQISNSTFSKNRARGNAALDVETTSVAIINSTFVGNGARFAGAVGLDVDTTGAVVNTTFANNRGGTGPGLALSGGGTFVLRNSVIWGSHGAADLLVSGASVDAERNDFGGMLQ